MGRNATRELLAEESVSFWLSCGLITVCGYICGLLRVPEATRAFTVLLLVAILILTKKSTGIWWGVVFVVVLTDWLYGKKSMSWDVASFELQSFHDWMHHQRPAYWDYSKLPSFYYGAWDNGRPSGMGFVYGIISLLFCRAVADVLELVQIEKAWLSVIYLMLILAYVAGSVFIPGKGDLLSCAMNRVVLLFGCLLLRSKTSGAENLLVFNGLLYGALAISAKLSAALFVVPFFLLILIRRPRLLARSWRGLISGVIVAGVLCLPFLMNIINYGQLLDVPSARDAQKFSLKSNGAAVIKAAIALNLIPDLIVFGVVYSMYQVFGRRVPSINVIAIWLILIFCMLWTPWTWLQGPNSMDSFRLVVFPLFAIFIICHDPQT